MKKNVLWVMILCCITLLGFNSCSSDDNDNTPEPPATDSYGAYVLNNGPYTENAASLAYYSVDANTVQKAVFKSVNGKELGDTGQDMIIYGSKIYIALYNSGLIFVTDKNCKLIATIDKINNDKDRKLQPRALESYNGNIYVTLYDGYLARIDTTTLTIDKEIAVGPNPEMVKAVNNKLYVANSGGFVTGYNNTVSIVNPELTTKKDIEVAVNPNILEKDKYNNLYLVSWGNWEDVKSTLQQINTSTDEVTTLVNDGRTFKVFAIDDKLYILDKAYDDSDKPEPHSYFFYYDIVNKKIVEESFITDNTSLADMQSVTYEPISKEYYVTVANKNNNGDVYIFTSDGKLKYKFDTGGAYPIGVWFLKK